MKNFYHILEQTVADTQKLQQDLATIKQSMIAIEAKLERELQSRDKQIVGMPENTLRPDHRWQKSAPQNSPNDRNACERISVVVHQFQEHWTKVSGQHTAEVERLKKSLSSWQYMSAPRFSTLEAQVITLKGQLEQLLRQPKEDLLCQLKRELLSQLKDEQMHQLKQHQVQFRILVGVISLMSLTSLILHFL